MSETHFSLFFNKDQFKLIVRYKQLHRFLFKQGIFVIGILGAIGVMYGLISFITGKETSEQTLVHGAATKERLLWSLQIQQIQSKYLNVLLPYGESKLEDKHVSSHQNLAFYKGVQVPREFSLLHDKEFFDIEAFHRGEASLSDIQQLSQDLLFQDTLSPQLSWHPSLPLKKGILSDFNLQCLDALKVSDGICFSFLHRLYEQGQYYNLSAYPQDLQILSKKLPNTTQLCELLYNNSLYQRKVFPAFNEMMMQCPKPLQEKYQQLNDFITIQNELDANTLSTTVYTQAELNVYKLLSALQLVYKQFSRASFDKTLLIPLLEFEQTLITKDSEAGYKLLPSLYKDILYWFNNAYVMPVIQTSKSSLSHNDKNQISYLIQQINNGNSVLGHVGLEKQITTPALIGEKTHSAAEIFTYQDKKITELLPKLFQDPRIKVGKYSVIEEENSVEMSITIKSTAIREALHTDL